MRRRMSPSCAACCRLSYLLGSLGGSTGELRVALAHRSASGSSRGTLLAAVFHGHEHIVGERCS